MLVPSHIVYQGQERQYLDGFVYSFAVGEEDGGGEAQEGDGGEAKGCGSRREAQGPRGKEGEGAATPASGRDGDESLHALQGMCQEGQEDP